MKKFDEEIVSGSVLRSVWKLTWPVALLNLINGSHGFIDQILLGHALPSDTNAANAAIGMSWSVFLVIMVFIASIFHGMNVLIARYAGRQDRANMSRVAYESFLFTVMVLVFVVAPIGYALSPFLLDFVNAQADVRVYALPYLRLLFLFGAPLFLMFMITGAFQASGDAKTPLVLGIFSSILNIVISFVLIPGVDPFDIPFAGGRVVHVPIHIPALGVIGAAIGTLVSPAITVAIAIGLVLRGKMIIQPPARFTLWPDLEVIRTVARIGIPTGVQAVLLNLGGVLLYKFLGIFGSAAQAAYTICYAQLFSLVTWTSFGLRAAASAVMGQNIGAGNPDRGRRGVAISALLGVGWALGIGYVFWFHPEDLLVLFDATGEPVFSYGKSLLHFLCFSGIVLAPTLALTGGIQGAGETKTPMYIAFLTQIVVLLGICSVFLLLDLLTLETIWAAILVSHASRLALTFGYFCTPRWMYTKVEIGP